MYTAGQIAGWIASILMFVSFQCKNQKNLIIAQTASTASLCVSYLLLGTYAGMIVYALAILRNLVIYYKKDVKLFSYRFWPYVFALVMAASGIFTWQGPISLLAVGALIINTLFIFSPNTQNLRRSIPLTASMLIVYNICVKAYGGIACELIGITSALIGLYRYRGNRAKDSTAEQDSSEATQNGEKL